MSDFDVRIDFYGLIGLVPAGDGHFLLPLPNADQGLELAGLPERIPPHLSCVVVPHKHLPSRPNADPACRPKQWALDFERPRKEKKRVFRFSLERLTLSYSGSATGATSNSTALDPRRHHKPSDPGAPPANDLAWVPSLKHTGITGADQFDSRLLGMDFVPGIRGNYRRLVGTVLLDSGNLSSTGVVPNSKETDAAVYDFIRAGNPSRPAFSQAMFQNMVWDDTASGDGLELVFTRGEGPDRRQHCVPLEPEDGRIDLGIYNWELEDILGIGFGTVPSKRNLDPDFAVGYWMSKAWGSLAAGDVFIPRKPPTGTGGSGEACKTGQYTRIS